MRAWGGERERTTRPDHRGRVVRRVRGVARRREGGRAPSTGDPARPGHDGPRARVAGGRQPRRPPAPHRQRGAGDVARPRRAGLGRGLRSSRGSDDGEVADGRPRRRRSAHGLRAAAARRDSQGGGDRGPARRAARGCAQPIDAVVLDSLSDVGVEGLEGARARAPTADRPDRADRRHRTVRPVRRPRADRPRVARARHTTALHPLAARLVPRDPQGSRSAHSRRARGRGAMARRARVRRGHRQPRRPAAGCRRGVGPLPGVRRGHGSLGGSGCGTADALSHGREGQRHGERRSQPHGPECDGRHPRRADGAGPCRSSARARRGVHRRDAVRAGQRRLLRARRCDPEGLERGSSLHYRVSRVGACARATRGRAARRGTAGDRGRSVGDPRRARSVARRPLHGDIDASGWRRDAVL